MKAARIHQYRQPLALDDVPIPKPGPGEILVHVEGAGFCHSDIHVLEGEIQILPRPPMILGHENARTDAAVGLIEVASLERINEVYARLKRGEIGGRAVINPAA